MTAGERAICASHADVNPAAITAHGKPRRWVSGFDASNPAGFACGFGHGRR